jgi:anti-sigma-K factor RskA
VTSEPTELHVLTGAYVLDALDDDEREVFEAHLDTCEPCAREVQELRATAAQLSAANHEIPPARLRERILLEAARTPQESPDPGVHPARPEDRGPLPRWAYRLAAAAVAVLVVAVAGLGYVVIDLNDRLDETQAASDRIAEVLAAPDASIVTSEADGVSGRVVVSADRGEAVIVTSGLQPAPSEHVYQLWLIDDDGATSAGLFDTDADGRAVEVLAGDLAEVAAIGVTLEPAGGSPQPTADPVLAIELGQASAE